MLTAYDVLVCWLSMPNLVREAYHPREVHFFLHNAVVGGWGDIDKVGLVTGGGLGARTKLPSPARQKHLNNT